MKHLIALLFALFTKAGYACDALQGTDVAINFQYCSADYAVRLSDKYALPDLAVYRMSPLDKPDTHFYRDHKTPAAYQINSVDYKTISHQKGMDYAHLASEKIQGVDKARFYQINRVAMHPGINRQGGLWEQTERYEVTEANIRGDITVLAGAIYTQSVVPTHFYKVLWQQDIAATIAFLIPNQQTSLALSDTVTSVACIEKLAGRLLNIEGMKQTHKAAKAFNLRIWTQGGGEAACHVNAEDMLYAKTG